MVHPEYGRGNERITLRLTPEAGPAYHTRVIFTAGWMIRAPTG
jgi:hypothetical protein